MSYGDNLNIGVVVFENLLNRRECLASAHQKKVWPVQADKKFLVVCMATLITAGCSSLTSRDIDSLPATASLPAESQQGKVDIWFYDNVSVSSVDQLDSLARYPDNPDSIVQVSKLEMPGSRGDRYASLVRGYITPSADGQYRFFLSSDDDSQFFLSSSESPAEALRVATVPGWTQSGNFTKYGSQMSGDFTLSADARYYFEIRHREASGGDHFAVAWEGPGFTQTVIGGENLSSFAGTSKLYPLDNMSVAGYKLGYRVGFFDGKQNLPFGTDYPPLDQDQDGLYDNWEVFHGLSSTNANDANADNDNDLLTNYDEFTLGSEPALSDSDGDGIPDGAEFAYELDPLDPADAAADSDGDGFSNLEEFVAGSDLTNVSDMPLPIESRVAGFYAQYFSGTLFQTFVTGNIEPQLNFDWGTDSPAPGVPEDYFSARYFTTFTPVHETGLRDYRLKISIDGGARVYLGDLRVVDRWWRSPGDISAQITVDAGSTYPFMVEYNAGPNNARLSIEVIDVLTGQVQEQEKIFTILSPNNPEAGSIDYDNDGIPDIWEYQQGTNAYIADSSVVNNSVGISNLEAFKSKLNPWTTEAIEGGGIAGPNINSPEQIPPTVGASQSSVTLTWTAPSTRVDGQSIALGDIKVYELIYGRQANSLDTKIDIPGQETEYTIENLNSGTWYFQLRTRDDNGVFSAPTEILKYIVK